MSEYIIDHGRARSIPTWAARDTKPAPLASMYSVRLMTPVGTKFSWLYLATVGVQGQTVAGSWRGAVYDTATGMPIATTPEATIGPSSGWQTLNLHAAVPPNVEPRMVDVAIALINPENLELPGVATHVAYTNGACTSFTGHTNLPVRKSDYGWAPEAFIPLIALA